MGASPPAQHAEQQPRHAQGATFFDSRLANPFDATIATASCRQRRAVGTYSFKITRLRPARCSLGGQFGRALNATSNVSGLVLWNASLATAITAAHFP